MNLVNLIYESFPPQKEGREEQKDITFSPSALSKCRRAYFWQRKGVSPSNPPDNASLFKMRMGDIIHDNIQGLLKEKGLLESAEIHKEIDFSGLHFNYYYDGIINLGADWRGILEIKTIYASGFRSIENEPKPEHVLQCLSYMVFEGLERAIILYIGRDNGYMLQYEIYLTITNEDSEGLWLLIDGKKTDYYAQWLEQIERLKGLKAKYIAGELPERDFQMVFKANGAEPATNFQKDNVKYESDWQCRYCSYKDKCWGDVIEQMKNHKFYINGQFA